MRTVITVRHLGRAVERVGLLEDIVSDLRAESEVFDQMLATIEVDQWLTPTPAEGWTVGDQVTHLAYFDEATTLAAVDEDAFREAARELETHGPHFAAWVALEYRSLSPAAIRAWFLGARAELLQVFTGVDPGRRLPWYGPSMSPASSITARLMETWAHGQDVAQAVGWEYPQTARLKHIAFLGFKTIDFSFRAHGLDPPGHPISIDLEAPDGSRWTLGDLDAGNTVKGTALAFCRVVTQRTCVSETDLVITGSLAEQWMEIAQAFAGPATTTSPSRSG